MPMPEDDGAVFEPTLACIERGFKNRKIYIHDLTRRAQRLNVSGRQSSPDTARPP